VLQPRRLVRDVLVGRRLERRSLLHRGRRRPPFSLLPQLQLCLGAADERRRRRPSLVRVVAPIRVLSQPRRVSKGSGMRGVRPRNGPHKAHGEEPRRLCSPTARHCLSRDGSNG
jgi:hypothetical protein